MVTALHQRHSTLDARKSCTSGRSEDNYSHVSEVPGSGCLGKSSLSSDSAQLSGISLRERHGVGEEYVCSQGRSENSYIYVSEVPGSGCRGK